MGKAVKGTKKFIKKGGLKREIARRPVQSKLNEARTNKVNKAKEYDARDKAQQSVEADFKKQLEMLVKQKKRLSGEDQVDFSDFLKKGLDSDDDFDISDDEEGDLEFGEAGQSMKGKKKGKSKKTTDMEEEDEGEESEEEDHGSEEEPEDFDEDMIDTEGDELEEEEGADGEEGGQERDGAEKEEEEGEEGEEGDGEDRQTTTERKKADMKENLNKLLDENEDLEEEVAAHREELRSLQELDPTFFDYLAKEGKDVLDFDKLSKEMKEKKQVESGGIITITSNLLNGWIKKAIEEDSIEDVKKILTSFQVSVMTEDEALESQMPFRIEKESVFNELVVFCLEQLTDIFYDLMDQEGKPSKPAKPTDFPTTKNVMLNTLPGFAKIKKLVYIYANVVFRLIEDSNDDVMLSFIIKNLVQFIPFIATSTTHTKRFLRSLLRIWATSSKEARTAGYICIRQLTLYCPYPFINTVLRGIYLVFMQNCKSMNSAATLDLVSFMRSCVVEVYGLDFECSYQHMFTYMRQLAVTLQKGLVAPTSATTGQVYSWQYMNALNLWTDVLSKYPKQENLQHLLYPLIQVIQGSITMDAHPKYYPYRIHLIRMLNSLASSNTHVFLTSTPFSLDILGGPLMQTPHMYGDRSIMVDFKVMRKVSEKVLRTKQFQDELLNQITELLATNLATYAYSVSFPELATVAIKIITAFMARMGDSAGSNHLAQLLTSIEHNATHIRKLREKSDKAPKDITNSLSTFFSPNLKNSEKAPVALFLVKFNKQVEKWETILAEKRVKMSKFDNYESDEEAGSGSDAETTTSQNGNAELNRTAEDDDDEEEDGKEEEEDGKEEEEEQDGEAKKKKDKKRKNSQKKEKKDKKRKTPPKLAKMNDFQEDVTGDLVLSDDEERVPRQKRVRKEKPKTDKQAQNGSSSTEKNNQKSKPLNGKGHEDSKPQNSKKDKKKKPL